MGLPTPPVASRCRGGIAKVGGEVASHGLELAAGLLLELASLVVYHAAGHAEGRHPTLEQGAVDDLRVLSPDRREYLEGGRMIGHAHRGHLAPLEIGQNEEIDCQGVAKVAVGAEASGKAS